MFGYIYITTNKINGKQYIGKKQSSTFDCNYFGSGSRLVEALKKYGKQNFSTEIIEWCETKEQLNEREKYWIAKYNAVENESFYNIAHGGDGGVVWGNPENHPSLGNHGCVGERNGMYGKSSWDGITAEERDRRKKAISDATKQRFSECKYTSIFKEGKTKRVREEDIDLYIKQGWTPSASYLGRKQKEQWYIGKLCACCNKPMEKLWGLGIYCSQACVNKSREYTKESSLKGVATRRLHESMMDQSELEKKKHEQAAKQHATIQNKTDEEKKEISNKLSIALKNYYKNREVD